MDLAGGLVLAILIVTLVVIVLERINETAAVLFGMSLAGGILYVFYGFEFRDFVVLMQWDTILFVMAMMIVVAIAASSGMFQYIALLLIRGTRGQTRRVFWGIMILVFGMSLFLDPLPTMLVMGPFTVEVCKTLDLDFRPFLISEVIVANLASFPTFVGSVPNLLIVVWANINVGFMFVVLMPLSVILFLVTIPLLLRYYHDSLESEEKSDANVLFMIRPGIVIKSVHDFYLSAIAMTILILGFTVGALRVEASLIAMMVASGMLVFSHERSKELLRRLSWDTVFFLVGLFGLIAALTHTGVIAEFVSGTESLIGSNVFLAIGFMIWIPGFVFSIIDNIPVAALLAPLGSALASDMASNVIPLALVAGTNIGGYIIPFGDTPNMVAVSLASNEGRPITFKAFTRVALPLGLLHLVLSTVYCIIAAFFI
jgi:Na+/H+ antiporter NhaD/arsenite permease-like protein